MLLRFSIVTQLTFVSLLLVGCYDPDERCDANQLYVGATQTCECVAGAVREDHACKLCGSNTEVVEDTCVCLAGYAADANGACQEIPSGLGYDCVSSADCANPDYPHCQDDSDGINYCTVQECSGNDQCAAGFTCAVWEDPSYCERAPTGIGNACTMLSDCEDFEANLCESQVLNMCITAGCSVADNDCPAGFFCCDVSTFGGTTICAPDSFMAVCPSS